MKAAPLRWYGVGLAVLAVVIVAVIALWPVVDEVFRNVPTGPQLECPAGEEAVLVDGRYECR